MINKIWHPYYEWEDFKHGMWDTISGKARTTLLKKAIEFTGDHNLYGTYMRRVINEWPIGCEQHLSGDTGNKRAWIGHAATCLAIRCPEDITRAAWAYLTKQQQDDANLEAELAIKQWEENYANTH